MLTSTDVASSESLKKFQQSILDGFRAELRAMTDECVNDIRRQIQVS